MKTLAVRASCWMKKKAYTRAIEDFAGVIASTPDDAGAHWQRGTAFEKLGYTDEAIKDFSRVLELDPGNYSALYARAACFNRKGLFSEAIEDYNLALTRDTSKKGALRFYIVN